ncbi:hypothetical protein SAMN05216553_10655 [Lentzea fradiae]|uniref:Uncharacterized protein n=1 Tax=Lentzea fradiae TaxID=200378 RepID=A0A1G7S5B2_9PSEU|nr:hypothetical protein [Lentzea fradiae]SDG18197.1 hypothetical protein SAMN05216553_10655 [Lentzea fradiae]
MIPHPDAFAIAKTRQRELEADAAARRLVKENKAEEEMTAEPERRRLRWSARVRHA